MSYLQSILGEKEQAIFKTRRHWLVISGDVVRAVTLALIVAIGAIYIFQKSENQVVLLLLFLLIIPLGRMAIVVTKWWNEQHVVTNRRIIQIEGIFNKHVIDSSLEKVNDVVMDQTFMGRLLGYGDVEILTASDIGVNKLEKISNPILFKTTMLNQKEHMTEVDGGVRMAPTAPRESITSLINELAALRDKGLITAEEFEAKKTELLSRL